MLTSYPHTPNSPKIVMGDSKVPGSILDCSNLTSTLKLMLHLKSMLLTENSWLKEASNTLKKQSNALHKPVITVSQSSPTQLTKWPSRITIMLKRTTDFLKVNSEPSQLVLNQNWQYKRKLIRILNRRLLKLPIKIMETHQIFKIKICTNGWIKNLKVLRTEGPSKNLIN